MSDKKETVIKRYGEQEINNLRSGEHIAIDSLHTYHEVHDPVSGKFIEAINDKELIDLVLRMAKQMNTKVLSQLKKPAAPKVFGKAKSRSRTKTKTKSK